MWKPCFPDFICYQGFIQFLLPTQTTEEPNKCAASDEIKLNDHCQLEKGIEYTSLLE